MRPGVRAVAPASRAVRSPRPSVIPRPGPSPPSPWAESPAPGAALPPRNFVPRTPSINHQGRGRTGPRRGRNQRTRRFPGRMRRPAERIRGANRRSHPRIQKMRRPKSRGSPRWAATRAPGRRPPGVRAAEIAALGRRPDRRAEDSVDADTADARMGRRRAAREVDHDVIVVVREVEHVPGRRRPGDDRGARDGPRAGGDQGRDGSGRPRRRVEVDVETVFVLSLLPTTSTVVQLGKAVESLVTL
jgi:hypothetical protein